VIDDENQDRLSRADLLEAWRVLSVAERREGFLLLSREEQEELFLVLPAHDQAALLAKMSPVEARSWIRFLAPDDAADVLQFANPALREQLLAQLDDATRIELRALLAYKADQAGGLMSPRFVRVRPEMSVDEAIRYLRKQASHRNNMIYYAYVLDEDQRPLGVVSFRQLFLAEPDQRIEDIMRKELVTVTEDMGQANVSQVFARRALLAVPVVDGAGHMKGVVTADDVVGAVQEEATKELHKFAAVEAFQEPYLSVGLGVLFKRRGGWLAFLFLGEMLTATAMGRYEHEISRAVVLALFIPLIISSGGNSGSQASTLVVRAMALGQVKLRDWWRVFFREVMVGVLLGLLLGALGLLRILLWPARASLYGEHYILVAITVACALVGVVLFGSMAGAMLPFLLRRLKLDPASACAPFVATLVDVSGLIIYFTVASIVLRGTLL
jgi:magnesium transporter